MEVSKTHAVSTERDLNILWLFAALVTLFLFFIDEGYYDFRWMKSLGNWLFFVLYCMILFLAELLFYKLILKNLSGNNKIALSVLGGILLGITGAFIVFSL